VAAKRDRAGEVADELYGRPVDEFTAARNEAAAAARADGDADAAEAISALRKPNAVAAAANALVRAHRDEVDELVELGATMRDATADLDAELLRKLSGQQRKVIAALVATARRDSGGTFSDATARGLEETLHAAMADPEAAEQLSAGRLTAGLTSSGFPGLGAAAASGARRQPKRPARARAGAKQTDEDALAAARDAEAEARDALVAARDDAAAADDQAAQAEQEAEDAAAEVSRLEDELARAREARVDADRAARDARRARDKAATAADRAERELRAATEARERSER